jgi:hypothetical protein
MATIKEEYVSFETSKLLKEKGFDWECFGYYVDDEPYDVKHSFLGETNSTWEARCSSAPTLQMAMKWLREVHKICIVVYPFTHRERGTYTSDICTVTMTMEEGHLRGVWNSYEEACEASIKYSLENLI